MILKTGNIRETLLESGGYRAAEPGEIPVGHAHIIDANQLG